MLAVELLYLKWAYIIRIGSPVCFLIRPAEALDIFCIFARFF